MKDSQLLHVVLQEKSISGVKKKLCSTRGALSKIALRALFVSTLTLLSTLLLVPAPIVYAQSPGTLPPTVLQVLQSQDPILSVGYDDPATEIVEGTITSAGLLRYFKVNHDTVRGELSFDFLFEATVAGTLSNTVGFILTDGKEPTSAQEYTTIYLEGKNNQAPVLSVYGFNKAIPDMREGLLKSWQSADPLLKATSERIVSSATNEGRLQLFPQTALSNDAVLPFWGVAVDNYAAGTGVSLPTPGSVIGLTRAGRRFRGVIKTDVINNYSPKFKVSAPWKGLGRGPLVGLWLLGVNLDRIAYNNLGFIVDWDINGEACHSVYQFRDLTPVQPLRPTPCETNEFKTTLFELDSGANALIQNLRWVKRRLARAIPSPRLAQEFLSMRRKVNRSVRIGEKMYKKAWEVSWSFPQRITLCSGVLALGCTEQSLTPLAVSYVNAAKELGSEASILAKFLKRSSAPVAKDLGKALEKSTTEGVNGAMKLVQSVPPLTVICSEQS
jgi:hypothetical protein